MMIRVLSLFSGMGGMDSGFADDVIVHRNSVSKEWIAKEENGIDGFVHLHRLPFEIVFQNDILPEAHKIATLNHWHHNYIVKDIRELIQSNNELPYADVVIGGFPCQDFSHAGKRQGMNTERGTLYQSFVQVVEKVHPLVFVAENVSGLVTMKGAIETIIADFTRIGYTTTYQLVKCEEHGIPQTRHRVIIIGVRADKIHHVPEQWHLITENKRQCTVSSYLSHLQEPDQTDDMAQRVYSKAKRLDKGQGQIAIKYDGFAPTIRAEHHGNIEFRRHGEHQRRLTIREVALLQTFPPQCMLMEKPTMKAYVPIGNAVPPLLGYIIARKVLEIITMIQ